MEIIISDTNLELGKKAGKSASEKIKRAITENGSANIILATGSSQFETITYLISDKTIDWSKVNMFHLDEYIGLLITHKASFRNYLTERFISKVPALGSYFLIDGEADLNQIIEYLGNQIKKNPIDVALVGIGENGHLAFNDPPADFETETPYLVVNLDEACRRQQVNEGWFDGLDQVPTQAISMSIKQIMKAKSIICSVPDQRKAEAVYNAMNEKISPIFPASILKNHTNCELYLDRESASLL
jgi:glucosamine-6-phosphate deaminase